MEYIMFSNSRGKAIFMRLGRLRLAFRKIRRTNPAHEKTHRSQTLHLPFVQKIFRKVRPPGTTYEKTLVLSVLTNNFDRGKQKMAKVLNKLQVVFGKCLCLHVDFLGGSDEVWLTGLVFIWLLIQKAHDPTTCELDKKYFRFDYPRYITTRLKLMIWKK